MSGRIQRAGRIASLFAAAVAILCARVARADPPPAGCQLGKIFEMPVKFEHNEPLVETQINGKSAWMLFDTGAAVTTLFGGVVKTYGLNVSTNGSRIYGVGGGQDVGTAIVSEFSFAHVKVKETRLRVIGAYGSPAEAGLLGRDLLNVLDRQHWSIEFDLPNSVIRFWLPDHCGQQSLAYWTKEPEVAELQKDGVSEEYRVPLQINGRRILATFDSGADVSTVTPDVARLAGVVEKNYLPGKSLTGGIGGRVVQRVATFDKVVIGDEQISHTKFAVVDMFAANTVMRTGSLLPQRVDDGRDEPAMLLGADFLRSHHVMLSPDQHRMYFTYSGAPVFEVVGDAVAPAAGPIAAGAPPSSSSPSAPSSAPASGGGVPAGR